MSLGWEIQCLKYIQHTYNIPCIQHTDRHGDYYIDWPVPEGRVRENTAISKMAIRGPTMSDVSNDCRPWSTWRRRRPLWNFWPQSQKTTCRTSSESATWTRAGHYQQGVRPFLLLFTWHFEVWTRGYSLSLSRILERSKWLGSDWVVGGGLLSPCPLLLQFYGKHLIFLVQWFSDFENVTIHTFQDGVKFSGFGVKLVTEHTVFCRKLNLLSQFGIFGG